MKFWAALVVFALVALGTIVHAEELSGPIVLWVDDSLRFEAEALFDEINIIPSLLWSDFEEICQTRLLPAVWNELQSTAPITRTKDGKKWVKLAQLKSRAIQVGFNPNTLELKILLSADAKATRVISLQEISEVRSKLQAHGAESLNGSLTAIGIASLHSRDSQLLNQFSMERDPFEIESEQILNYKTSTIANRLSFKESPLPGQSWLIKKIFTQLTHDWPNSDLRWTLGDLNIRGGILSAPGALMGIALQKEYFSSDSRAHLMSSVRFEIEIQRKSRVEAWMGKQLVGVFYLEPGRYDFRDFPAQLGIVESQLHVQDDLGRTVVYNATYFQSARLLKAGTSVYQYYLGIPRFDSLKEAGIPPERGVPTSSYILGLTHRIGLSEKMTAGIDLQKKAQLSLSAVSVDWGHSFGILESSLSWGSDTDRKRTGILWSVSESISFGGMSENSQNTVRLGVNFTRGDFPVSLVTPHWMTSWTSVWNNDWAFGAGLNSDSRQISLNYATPIGAYLRLNLERSWLAVAHQEETHFEMFLTWNFSKASNNSLARYKSQDHSIRVETAYQTDPVVGAIQARAGIETSAQHRLFDSDLRYFGNRWESAWSQQTIFSKKSGVPNTAHRFQFGSSLVFSGAHFGIARPASQGFVIIHGDDGLSGEKLLVNLNSQGQWYANSDFFGEPILVMPMTPYERNSVTIDLADTSHAAMLPERDCSFFPSFKSGSAIMINRSEEVSIEGKVLKPDLAAAARLDGTLRNSDGKAISFFTDDSGHFFVDKIAKGHWSLEVGSDIYEVLSIDLANNNEPVIDIGSLRLSFRKKTPEKTGDRR